MRNSKIEFSSAASLPQVPSMIIGQGLKSRAGSSTWPPMELKPDIKSGYCDVTACLMSHPLDQMHISEVFSFFASKHPPFWLLCSKVNHKRYHIQNAAEKMLLNSSTLLHHKQTSRFSSDVPVFSGIPTILREYTGSSTAGAVFMTL